MKIWILQTGEFLQIDKDKGRPMRAINLSEYFLKKGHSVNLLSSDFSHQLKLHRNKKLTVKNLEPNFQITLCRFSLSNSWHLFSMDFVVLN